MGSWVQVFYVSIASSQELKVVIASCLGKVKPSLQTYQVIKYSKMIYEHLKVRLLINILINSVSAEYILLHFQSDECQVLRSYVQHSEVG